MQKSPWSDTVEMPKFGELTCDIKTDVLIIGGGMCGILCAYFLKQAGVDCVLVEGNKIASGITKNTTAKITSQHGLIYSKLVKKIGIDQAKLYLKAHQAALEEYVKLSKSMDCDFEQKNAYVYSVHDKKKIEDELNALEQIGYKASFQDKIELPFRIQGAVCFENQAQFHPLKFISQISKKLNIYENTFITEVKQGKAITEKATIKADAIIVATHFPFINKVGSYFLKMYQERSYVASFQNAQTLNGMYLDESNTGFSFRSYHDMLFIGTGCHRTGKDGVSWQHIDEFVRQYYPHANLRYQWATQDCITLDSMPYIGLYSKFAPSLYVATGFNKWGMTSSMLSALILTDILQEKENEYQNLFTPQRSMLKSQLAVNAFETVSNFITLGKKRCPHLGCSLKWNKMEHTWDCPCHGSRFERNGKRIDNPSNKDMK